MRFLLQLGFYQLTLTWAWQFKPHTRPTSTLLLLLLLLLLLISIQSKTTPPPNWIMKYINLNALLSLLFFSLLLLINQKCLYEFKFLLIWCLFLNLNVKLLSSLTNYESIRLQICALQIYKNFRIKQISQSSWLLMFC